MSILVLNAGSSTIKYKLYDSGALDELASGMVEHIGESGSATPNFHEGIASILEELKTKIGVNSIQQIAAVGHRVVHGGRYSQPAVIDETVLAEIQRLKKVAPIHNSASLEGINAVSSFIPNAIQVAVFDTAFHQTIEEASYRYAIPKSLADEHEIRRYGFHGISHAYMLECTSKYLNKPSQSCNLITLHLGNGASVCAIKNGKSVDTSMGFSPLEGLMMGSRSGDIDPEVILYLQNEASLSRTEMVHLLYKESGLKGICQHNDMREIQRLAEENERDALLAIEMYVRRIVKYIGAYALLLGDVDAIIFSGGIGEHSAMIRREVVSRLSLLGIRIDETKNAAHKIAISSDDSTAAVLIVQADEESAIAKQVQILLERKK